jgi:hypothetical protein
MGRTWRAWEGSNPRALDPGRPPLVFRFILHKRNIANVRRDFRQPFLIFKSWALIATITVLKDMRTAPNAGLKTIPF